MQRTAPLRRVRIIDVHDGDTLKTSDGTTYRLYCIDAPELVQPDGPEAGAALLSMVEQNDHILYVQEHGRELHHRMLGTFYTVPHPTSAEQNINYLLVLQGDAWVYRFKDKEYTQHKPIVPEPEDYEIAERIARQQRRGLWANPKAERPSEYRRKKREAYRVMREQLGNEDEDYDMELEARPGFTRRSLWSLLSKKDSGTSQFAALIKLVDPQLMMKLQGASRQRPGSKTVPYTIFAPKNDMLDLNSLTKLAERSHSLAKDIVNRHIVFREYPETSFVNITVDPLQGPKYGLTLVTPAGHTGTKLVVDKFEHVAHVGKVLKARNGIIYVVDKVLGPMDWSA